MAFKSYSWSIGTTSFRVSQLNYKIERQLQLLKQFWLENPNANWVNNNEIQVKYYYFMKKNGFLIGDANIPDKDAREKTSGLVDIGVLTKDRKITEVGNMIESLLDKERVRDNIFYIDEDSYYYLLQFLKLQINNDGLKIKPFVALIYMLEKLDYLNYDEFTYLLPLCKNKYDVIKMVSDIKDNRKGLDIDSIIINKIYDMDNYVIALNEFIKDYPVTEKTFELIGMNRKSASYEHAYLPVYNELVNLVFHLRHNTFEERIESYKRLYEYCKNISGNAKSHWVSYLFMNYLPRNFDDEFDKKFRELEISEVKNIIDFKRVFFEREHIIKWRVNLKEYFDLNRRYFSLTDIVKFGEDKIELDLLPKYYFKEIIDDLLDEKLLENEEYYRLFHSLIPIEEISDKYRIDISKIVNDINRDLNTNLTIDSISTYLEDEKIKQFNKLIDDKFNENDLLSIIDLIKERRDSEVCNLVSDNADVPTIFEYILGIAWYRISNKEGNILKYMNLSLDADLLPKTHAGGGMADIVYEYKENGYPKHNLLIEATISESTGQRKMELESVPRHLANDIIITNNQSDYALFVATNLEESVILSMRGNKTTYYPKGNNEYINGLKIIPIDTNILKKIIINHKKYADLYSLFDSAYKSQLPDPEWFEKEILQKI